MPNLSEQILYKYDMKLYVLHYIHADLSNVLAAKIYLLKSLHLSCCSSFSTPAPLK